MRTTRRQLLSGLAATSIVPFAYSATMERMLLSGADTIDDLRLVTGLNEARWEDARTWTSRGATGLPESHQGKLFTDTDECKVIDNGRSILATASSGGVVIYDRASLETKFYASAANAHSACLLPGGYVVVAASVNAKGNALVLFHQNRSAQEIFRTPLESAHGVVWDERRKVLFAIGMTDVEEYRFDPANKERPLQLLRQHRMPTGGGHELSPGPSENLLFASGTEAVYLFDKDSKQFRLHPELGKLHHVKSISLHPKTGRIAYMMADPGEGVWWSYRVRFLNPTGEIASPGKRLYKVRWG